MSSVSSCIISAGPPSNCPEYSIGQPHISILSNLEQFFVCQRRRYPATDLRLSNLRSLPRQRWHRTKISTMRWFRYAPLSSNEQNRNFRFLEILPGKGDDIACNLKHISLDEKPKYETISYCWGDSKAVKRIQCTAQYPGSLYFALRQFRYKKEIRTLWADAICISQSDPDEKSSQIPHMSDIYRNALCVLVWLGRESHDSALAMSFISELHPTIKNAAPPLVNPIADLNPGEKRAWHEFLHLLERPWFCRVWVIQEIAVASKVVIHCWSSFLLWDTLVEVCGNTLKSAAQMKLPSFGLSAVLFLGEIRLNTMEGAKFGLLLQALLMSRSFHASDPRDKLYAICGLTEDSGSQHLTGGCL